MYCPKCKQNFEEGSRRFCPTDGARLVSEVSSSGNKSDAGIFASLIPKMDAISDLGGSVAELPGVVVSTGSGGAAEKSVPFADGDGVFFEIDDKEPEPDIERPILDLDDPTPRSHDALKPQLGRKIDPRNIPAGHVELGGADAVPSTFLTFDENQPSSFVGCIVKGRYKVTEFLGGEQNCFAYLANDKILEDKKALVRVITKGRTDDIIDSILAEERVSLSHFSHPNIARLIDSGQFANGTLFLITEYVDALSVADIIQIHGHFSVERASRVIRQISNALNDAHQQGILHRDIRPSNIIIEPIPDDGEQAKLVNFGTSSEDRTTRNLECLSPEVLDGRISTTASDIFSLAVVSFQMLTGRNPFNGASPREMLRAQYAGPIVTATELRGDLPPMIDDVFEKALSFRPAGRFRKAREFGDAICSALAGPSVAEISPAAREQGRANVVDLMPLVPAPTGEAATKRAAEPGPSGQFGSAKGDDVPVKVEPAWKTRSPEPPETENSRFKLFAGAGLLALLAIVAVGWYYVANNQAAFVPADFSNHNVAENSSAVPANPIVESSEMPPLPRSLAQPPDTNFYQNSKENLKGDLLLNFVGFTLFYPKTWKLNGPQQGFTSRSRGKFLDISRLTPDGRLQEQMLISYYPSKGTFVSDMPQFTQLVQESNETLEKLLPGYQMVSQGEITINGSWRAYELRFQGGGTSPSGDKLTVWGRRIFIPAGRPGVRNGFEITMLATSLAEDVRGVEEVGIKGELGPILYSFEPSQNF